MEYLTTCLAAIALYYGCALLVAAALLTICRGLDSDDVVVSAVGWPVMLVAIVVTATHRSVCSLIKLARRK